MTSTTTEVEERIHAATAKREALLATIAATQHAASTLSQLKLDLSDLVLKSYDLDVAAGYAREAAEKEQKEYEDIKGSLLRKAFYGSGKYNALLRKEEDEHVEAQESLEKATKANEEQKDRVVKMKKTRDVLEKMKDQHVAAQIELEDLYKSVFEGPTPISPEEDQIEADLDKAQKAFDPIQTALSIAISVVNYVTKARVHVASAETAANRALKASKDDMLDKPRPQPFKTTHVLAQSYRSAYPDVVERQQLRTAEENMDQAIEMLIEAHKIDPDVRGFDKPEIPDGSSVAGKLDQYINLTITDYLFHREIKASADEIASVGRVVGYQLGLAEEKVQKLVKDRDTASDALAQIRKKLHEKRAQVFEQFLRGEHMAAPTYEDISGETAPPPYTQG